MKKVEIGSMLLDDHREAYFILFRNSSSFMTCVVLTKSELIFNEKMRIMRRFAFYILVHDNASLSD